MIPWGQPSLTAQERESFVAGQFRLEALAPMRLYRLLGVSAQGNWNSAFGQKCWFAEDVFFDCVCDARTSKEQPARALASLRFLLRDRLAVRADWNDFRAFVSLRIPQDANVMAAVGRAAAQPYMVNGHGPGKQLGPLLLAGGAMQYIIDVGARLNGFLQGPQPLSFPRA